MEETEPNLDIQIFPRLVEHLQTALSLSLGILKRASVDIIPAVSAVIQKYYRTNKKQNIEETCKKNEISNKSNEAV